MSFKKKKGFITGQKEREVFSQRMEKSSPHGSLEITTISAPQKYISPVPLHLRKRMDDGPRPCSLQL
jgi:hypothetical protein